VYKIRRVVDKTGNTVGGRGRGGGGGGCVGGWRSRAGPARGNDVVEESRRDGEALGKRYTGFRGLEFFFKSDM
jgi:hypothetical protein